MQAQFRFYQTKKALVTDFSAIKNPDLPKSDIAIMPTPELGKGGMIYEVAMPFTVAHEGKSQGGKPKSGLHPDMRKARMIRRKKVDLCLWIGTA